ncbi:DUF4476 domain-containing protein [Microvirga sp. STR05]|uniref:DUF4476 domain-containing protein n=1 Tax=Hymenobacter duratus TaxID=2771356 RepID=A0ABR8JAG7_9BACT|nr:DUF4476 domain-containing protein [Hymenobacter duratus]MBD2713557.1 DUF4476 domain-containing protein [Hymenobacter duratus]MBR7948459.1 DUF4476 domain-containing protein [Microvirga sp. STR05]
MVLVAAARLQAAPANVNFASERGVPFDLRFDGRPLTRGGARQVHIDRIAAGTHMAEFLIPTANGRAISYRTRVFLDPGLETSFVLLTRPGRAPELRKVAAVPLRGGYYGNGPGGYPNGGPVYGNGGYGSQPPINQPGGYGNGGYTTGNQDNEGYYPGGGVSYNRLMAPQDVDALRAAVQRQSFDKDKLPLLQQALNETTIQADDLALLMKELSFESSKMELAKFGAGRVADRQNLYRLNEGFTFSATAREFQEYLAQQQR